MMNYGNNFAYTGNPIVNDRMPFMPTFPVPPELNKVVGSLGILLIESAQSEINKNESRQAYYNCVSDNGYNNNFFMDIWEAFTYHVYSEMYNQNGNDPYLIARRLINKDISFFIAHIWIDVYKRQPRDTFEAQNLGKAYAGWEMIMNIYNQIKSGGMINPNRNAYSNAANTLNNNLNYNSPFRQTPNTAKSNSRNERIQTNYTEKAKRYIHENAEAFASAMDETIYNEPVKTASQLGYKQDNQLRATRNHYKKQASKLFNSTTSQVSNTNPPVNNTSPAFNPDEYKASPFNPETDIVESQSEEIVAKVHVKEKVPETNEDSIFKVYKTWSNLPLSKRRGVWISYQPTKFICTLVLNDDNLVEQHFERRVTDMKEEDHLFNEYLKEAHDNNALPSIEDLNKAEEIDKKLEELLISSDEQISKAKEANKPVDIIPEIDKEKVIKPKVDDLILNNIIKGKQSDSKVFITEGMHSALIPVEEANKEVVHGITGLVNLDDIVSQLNILKEGKDHYAFKYLNDYYTDRVNRIFDCGMKYNQLSVDDISADFKDLENFFKTNDKYRNQDIYKYLLGGFIDMPKFIYHKRNLPFSDYLNNEHNPYKVDNDLKTYIESKDPKYNNLTIVGEPIISIYYDINKINLGLLDTVKVTQVNPDNKELYHLCSTLSKRYNKHRRFISFKDGSSYEIFKSALDVFSYGLYKLN